MPSTPDSVTGTLPHEKPRYRSHCPDTSSAIPVLLRKWVHWALRSHSDAQPAAVCNPAQLRKVEPARVPTTFAYPTAAGESGGGGAGGGSGAIPGGGKSAGGGESSGGGESAGAGGGASIAPRCWRFVGFELEPKKETRSEEEEQHRESDKKCA